GQHVEPHVVERLDEQRVLRLAGDGLKALDDGDARLDQRRQLTAHDDHVAQFDFAPSEQAALARRLSSIELLLNMREEQVFFAQHLSRFGEVSGGDDAARLLSGAIPRGIVKRRHSPLVTFLNSPPGQSCTRFPRLECVENLLWQLKLHLQKHCLNRDLWDYRMDWDC